MCHAFDSLTSSRTDSLPGLTVGWKLDPGPIFDTARTTTACLGSLSGGDLAQWTDEALLGCYRDSRRTDLFHELVRRHERELYRYLVRYLGDRTLADDVLQNTFLQVHLKCGLFQGDRPFRPWLYAIAAHQAIDALRKAGREAALSLDRTVDAEKDDPCALIDLLIQETWEPLTEWLEDERRQWVQESVASLPEPLRQVLILAYHQELKYREIAEVLGIRIGTVKSRLHKAIAKLQEMARSAHLVEVR